MKPLVLVSFLTLMVLYLPGQSYEFEIDSGAFTPLSDPVSLNNGGLWFGDEWTIQPGFEFEFFDVPFSSLILWEGSVYFSDDLFLDAFGASFQDLGWYSGNLMSLSPVSYQIEGNIGNQILKLEYLNAGFWPATIEDYISFQVWLYEGSNILEIHIGPGMVDPYVYQQDGWDGPYIGLSNYLSEEFIYIEGDPTAPTLYYLDDSTNGMNTTPPDGLIYRFIPDDYVATEAIEHMKMARISIQESQVAISGLQGNEQIQLFDLQGRTLAFEEINGQKEKIISLNHIPGEGIYIIQIKANNYRQTEKFFVKGD